MQLINSLYSKVEQPNDGWRLALISCTEVISSSSTASASQAVLEDSDTVWVSQDSDTAWVSQDSDTAWVSQDSHFPPAPPGHLSSSRNLNMGQSNLVKLSYCSLIGRESDRSECDLLCKEGNTNSRVSLHWLQWTLLTTHYVLLLTSHLTPHTPHLPGLPHTQCMY